MLAKIEHGTWLPLQESLFGETVFWRNVFLYLAQGVFMMVF